MSETAVQRKRWPLPLLLCSAQAAEDEGDYPLDRVRIQKAIFLLTRRGSANWHDLYEYEAYDWGPYCRDLVQDLRSMSANGLLRVGQGPGLRYGRYALTKQGEDLAHLLWRQLDDHERRFIKMVRRYVTSKDFNSLLREVYAEYPEYATESRWAGRR
jgi:uncharacterized protein YwgA